MKMRYLVGWSWHSSCALICCPKENPLNYITDMKKLLLITAIFFGVSLIAESQITYNSYVASLMENVSGDSLNRFVRHLTGDTACMIGGAPYTIVSRHYSKQGNAKAAQYILERFQSYGLTSSYQTITSSLANVLGKKTGYRYPNQYVIICAHFDNMPSTTTAPGADDNATGTAAVIEAARVLSSASFPYTILFAAWDEEERGLYGSKAYADTARRKGDSIIAVLNFDMIGYDGNNNGALDINTNTASTPLANDFYQCVTLYQPTLVPQITTSLNGGSDHQSFQQKNYPAILSIEDNSDFTPYYHTVNDNYSTLNKPYFLKMTKAGVAALVTLAGNYKLWTRFEFTAGIEGMWNGTVQAQDTVRVYLRSSVSPFAVVDQAKLFLNSSGYSAANFENVTTGNYYIQYGHRSAIETWSFAPVPFTRGSSVSFSFITSASQAYGSNLVLKAGRYCSYSGDADADGTIDASDGSLVDNGAFNFMTGYTSLDINGDNIVDGSDMLIVDNNAANYVEVMRP